MGSEMCIRDRAPRDGREGVGFPHGHLRDESSGGKVRRRVASVESFGGKWAPPRDLGAFEARRSRWDARVLTAHRSMTSSSSCEPHSGSSGGPSESSDDSASSPRGALRRPDGAPFASSSRSSSCASPSMLRRFSRSSSRSSDSCRAVVSARSSARVSCDGVWTVEGGQTARARRGRGRLGRHEIDVVPALLVRSGRADLAAGAPCARGPGSRRVPASRTPSA